MSQEQTVVSLEEKALELEVSHKNRTLADELFFLSSHTLALG